MPKILNVKDGARPGPDCIYIGRFHRRRGLFLPASKWRNPFKMSDEGDRDEVCDMHEEWLFGKRPSPPGHRADPAKLLMQLDELHGKDLLCHCAPERCHGELLLRLAGMTEVVCL